MNILRIRFTERKMGEREMQKKKTETDKQKELYMYTTRKP